MAGSIAKKVTSKVLIVLIAAQVLLFAVSYLLVQRIISDNAKEENKAMVTVYADMVTSEASARNMPIDESFADGLIPLGDYICRLHNIEFAYLFIPDLETGRIRYICVSQNSKFNSINPDDKYIGKITNYTLTEDEKAVWLGEKEISHSVTVSTVGHEISTMVRVADPYGRLVMAGVDQSYEGMNREVILFFSILAAATILVNCMIYLFVYLVMKKCVSVPAGKVCEVMNGFLSDGSRSDLKLQVNGNDEFAMISASFNKMSEDMDLYLENIKQLNRAQERQNTELDIAAKIQQGFLAPGKFYANDCEIFAMMTPAKNVGGDFYDYFVLNDGRILMTIADVSGKGIAASMYMAVTLIVMRQFALTGRGPAYILRGTNNIISQNNKNMFFATAFVGIYDPESREFVYSNAGHTPPYILRDKPELLTGARNLVLGLYENESYTEEKISLNSGDIVFLYTDGVTETIDENRGFFGEKRLKKTLDEFRPSHEENIVEFVSRSVSDFSKNARQHDDITMLSCTIKHRTILELSPDKKEFDKIKQVILASRLPRSLQLSLCVAAEEIYINICSYAFEGKSPEYKKNIRFVFEHSDRILMRFEDNGIEYNPTDDVQLDSDYDPDSQLGGLGKIIAFTIADKINYEYTDNRNILTIVKYLMEVNDDNRAK